MKLLYLLLIIIIIIVLVYNSTKMTSTELPIQTESNSVRSNQSGEKIPRITYDKDGTVNTLPIVNTLPFKHINNPMIPDETHIRKDVDLLIQSEFNMDKMNLNRWNYGNPDFAPYIDGSYKQNTNNYVPGYKFNDNKDFTEVGKQDVKINAWRNRSDNNFLVQCS